MGFFYINTKSVANKILNTFIDKIFKVLDDGEILLGVFLGPIEAFYTGNHKILLNKSNK